MVWQAYKSALSNRPLLTKALTASAIMSFSDVLCQNYERYAVLADQHQARYLPEPILAATTTTATTTTTTTTTACDAARRGGPSTFSLGGPTATTGLVKATSPAMAVDPRFRQSSTSSEEVSLSAWDPWRTLHVGVTGLTFSGPLTHAWYNLLERVVPAILSVFPPFTTTTFAAAGWLGPRLVIQLLLDALVFSPVAIGGYFVWRSCLEGKDWAGTKHKLATKWRGALSASWSFWPAANVLNFTLVPLQYRVLYNNCLSVFWNGYLTNANSRKLPPPPQPQPQPHHHSPEKSCLATSGVH